LGILVEHIVSAILFQLILYLVMVSVIWPFFSPNVNLHELKA